MSAEFLGNHRKGTIYLTSRIKIYEGPPYSWDLTSIVKGG